MSLVEADWMQYANCLVEEPEDTDFIRRPTPDEEKRWEAICKQCPVSLQCMDWADSQDPPLSGVFIAGEWRE